MPEIKSSFLQGKMNKDLDDRILPKGQYRDAENIKIAKSDSSNVGAAQNIKGNTIQYTTSLGLPTSAIVNLNDEVFPLWDTIGYYANSQTGDVFWFVTSFAGPTSDNVLDHKAATDVVVGTNDVTHDDDTTGHRLVEIANASNHDIQVGMKVTGSGVAADSYVQSVSTTSNVSTIRLNKAQSAQTVLDGVALTFSHTCRIYKINTIEGTTPTAIIDNKKLNFSKNHHIHHVNQLSNLLFWTDNYNQPRRINIETNSYPDDVFFEDRISVAQVAPYAAPKVRMTKVSASTVPSLHIRDKFVKFGYRYVYANNEVSLISPFTQTCFLPGKDKNINNGSFKDGDAGILSLTERAQVQKTTVVDMMQNMVNRVRLFIDLPSDVAAGDTTQNNVASADAGNTGSVAVDAHLVGAAQSNQTINSISTPGSVGSAAGVIDNTTTVLTERGDKYTVHSITENSDLALDSTIKFNEEIPAEHAILHGEKLYFFKNISNYTNPLNIKRVEIVYAESNSPAVKVVETIKIPTGPTSLNAIIKHRVDPGTDTKGKLRYGIEYVYDSSKPIKTLPEQDITRVSDIVPLKAKAQEVSGNRIIYGNFKINRPITNLVNNKDQISVTNRDQTRYNTQYLLHSVKQNREYSVGLVLSDKYGRQSTVFLPTTNTTFVTPKAGTAITPFTGGTYHNPNRWNGTALNIDFGAAITDVYDSTTNPYGWDSYKVVVKQAQQEYYNVYVPSLIDDFPTTDKSSWVTLFGDNVNKVPRDILDDSLDDRIASSKTKLLPKILNVDSATSPLLGNGHKQQNTTDFVEIIAIGEATQFGSSNHIGQNNAVVNKDRNPIVAELPDGFGGGSGPSTSKLCVLETDPFISALDIYFETSTAGLISDLNENIQASLTSSPSNISLTANTFAENIAANTNIATLGYTDTQGNSPSGETYTLESVQDGGNNNRISEFQLVGDVLKTASGVNHLGHEFRNRPEDTFTFEFKVTDSGGTPLTQFKTITLTNIAPTIIPTTVSVNVPDNTTTGNLITTFSGSNGCGKTGSALQNGLSFSIISGNGQGDFGITGSTGEVHATEDSWTAGDTYSLGVRVTDAGGLTADATLNITITASTVTRFYRSPGNTSQSGACSDAAQQQAYHDGLGDLPSAGDKVYTNNTGTTLFNGQNAYYVASTDPVMAGVAGYNIRINSSGVVSNPTLCPE